MHHNDKTWPSPYKTPQSDERLVTWFFTVVNGAEHAPIRLSDAARVLTKSNKTLAQSPQCPFLIYLARFVFVTDVEGGSWL